MKKPNIILILADDMGYGDWGRNNPESRIPTPHLDRLADEGMRFSDAHAASSVCTPSRYALLTGRYCWRSRLKQGIVWPWDSALIEPDRPTLASILRDQGYATACIGKWHLGWDWKKKDGTEAGPELPFGVAGAERHAMGEQIDFSARIGGGPVDRGFDSYFGVDVPNFPPYAWFEDDHLTALPTQEKPEHLYGNPGPAVPDWNLEAMIPEFTRRAVRTIHEKAAEGRPFFLYFPLTSPHSPIVPNPPFRGRSGAGNYGDFVCEVDDVVGQVMQALDDAGVADDTLLLFTSDNGPEHQTADDIGVWQRILEHGHASMGALRGIKRDLWEGGHRVPFVARYPRLTAPGSTCETPVSLVDVLATCSELAGAPRAPGQAEDSHSFLDRLRGDTHPAPREPILLHSMRGDFGIRDGDWVFIDAPTGDDNLKRGEPDWFKEQRGYAPHHEPGELFDLREDLAERTNRYATEPERVAMLRTKLSEIKTRGEPG